MKILTIIFTLLLSNVVLSSIDIQNDKIYKDLDGNINYSLNICKNFKSKYIGVEFTINSKNYRLNDYNITSASFVNAKLQCEFTEISYIISPTVFNVSPEDTLITSSGGNIYPFASNYSPILSGLINKTVNLLFIYNQSSLRSAIDSKIQLSIDQINNSFNLSGLSVTTENIGVIEVNTSITTSNYDTINAAIVAGNSGFEQIPNLMKTYNADFYVFINDDRVLDTSTTPVTYIAGSVNEIMGSLLNKNGDLSGDKNKMNGMVIWSGASNSGLTFSHEMGHLFGLWHDFSSSSNKILSYAKGHAASDEEINEGKANYGTIMSYEDLPALKQYFSNPYNSNCNGSPCGVNKYETNGSDAVAALNITLPQILEFRYRDPNTPKPNVTTKGNDIVVGTDGDDIIDTLSGNDIIFSSGSIITDTIYFRSGQDQFHIKDEISMGNTVIHGFGMDDKIVFLRGMTEYDYNLNKSGNDLILNYIGGAKITIKDFYLTLDDYIIERDFETWGESLKAKMVSTIIGTNNSDVLGDSDRTSNHYLINDGLIDSKTEGHTFISKGGSDTLFGSRYGDTYIFKVGDHTDYISDYSCATIQDNTRDTIEFKDYLQIEVEYEKSDNGQDLIIRHAASAPGWNTVIVENYFNSSNCYKIEQIKFKDGTILSTSRISFENQQPSSCFVNFIPGYNYICGTNGDDYGSWRDDSASLNGIYNLKNIIYGFDGRDKIKGGSKSDILYGGSGKDILKSGHGNDEMYGGDGNDTLYDGLSLTSISSNYYEGGKGDDYMFGTEKKDIFKFNIGDGIDVVSGWACGIDDIVFGSGISLSSISISRRSDNGSIYISYGGGRIEIPYIKYVDISIGKCSMLVDLNFQDGSVLTWAEIVNRSGLPENLKNKILP